jgi:branched-chain amino acid transport system ATP-binding protein
MIIQEVFRLLALLRDGGTSILLVEQNARAALDVADEAFVVEDGRIALSGPADALRDSDQVRDFYLGQNTSGERRSFRSGRLVRRRQVFGIAQ